MKIIHVSDTHLMRSEDDKFRPGTIKSLDAALRDIILRHRDAELIVITGDLVNDGALEGYEVLAELTSKLPIPVELMLGNHDDRENFLKVFPVRRSENGFVQSMRQLSSGRALFLDTTTEGRHSGTLCSKRLAWLEAQLTADDGPFWIFMHHHPIPTHLPQMDRIMLADANQFGDIVADHRDHIAHIFHGHLHLPMSGSLYGVPVSCQRGTSFTGYPNYGEDRLLPHSNFAASYGVILVDGPATTVMMVEYGGAPEALAG
ncbi:MAG: phosphodiesterase [Pseudomonadota bacterium]